MTEERLQEIEGRAREECHYGGELNYIAHAREDIDELVREVRVLRYVILTGEYQACGDCPCDEGGTCKPNEHCIDSIREAMRKE